MKMVTQTYTFMRMDNLSRSCGLINTTLDTFWSIDALLVREIKHEADKHTGAKMNNWLDMQGNRKLWNKLEVEREKHTQTDDLVSFLQLTRFK